MTSAGGSEHEPIFRFETNVQRNLMALNVLLTSDRCCA